MIYQFMIIFLQLLNLTKNELCNFSDIASGKEVKNMFCLLLFVPA